tara:strand:- start:334 stop:1245 length:912 start_codon:yes stop_codon:yes gene_type:complete
MKKSTKNNYIIQDKDLDQILSIGSNHPRRKRYFTNSLIKKFIIKKDTESNFVPKIINAWKLKSFSKKLNIVIGDSHSEFNTRYYKSIVEKNFIPLNLSLTFWTGPTTLIGSILSSNYYDHLKKSLIQIILSTRELNFDLKKVNVIISLGEIDVRTKIQLEVLRKGISFNKIIDQNINDSYALTLNALKKELSEIFKDLSIVIYFKIPCPPSALDFELPLNYENALDIINSKPYPRIGNLKARISTYQYLINKIKSLCKKNNIKLLENKSYYKNFTLDEKNSHDGIHVSKGEWAFFNFEQLLKL